MSKPKPQPKTPTCLDCGCEMPGADTGRTSFNVCVDCRRKAWEDKPVAAIIADLEKVEIPPHQLQKLGLQEGWNKNIPPEFVRRVLEIAERHRKALEGLAKH